MRHNGQILMILDSFESSSHDDQDRPSWEWLSPTDVNTFTILSPELFYCVSTQFYGVNENPEYALTHDILHTVRFLIL